MGAPDVLARLAALGVRLTREGESIRAAPRSALTDEARELIRAHKAELLAALSSAGGGDPLPASEFFCFAPPGDPANDNEALAERAAIMAVENGWTEAQALQEARWQAHRERAWRAFLRNAALVLAAPEGEREALLARYEFEATRHYGEPTGPQMAATLRGWVQARAAEQRGKTVH